MCGIRRPSGCSEALNRCAGLEIFLAERLFGFAEMRPEFVGDVS